MSESQEIMFRIKDAANSRERLIEIMSDIDDHKRALKHQLRSLSSDPDNPIKGAARERFIREKRAKIGLLTNDREQVRLAIKNLNDQAKKAKSLANKKPQRAGFDAAFFMAASEILTPEKLAEIELAALKIIETGDFL